MPLRQGIKDGQLNWNDNRYLRLSATDQTVQGIVRFDSVYADSMSITDATVVSLTATDITTASLTVSDLTDTYIPVAGTAGLLGNSILTQTSTNTINAITTASATAYTVTLDNTTALSQGSTINFLHATSNRGVIGCRARIESQAAYAGLGIQSADNLYLYSAGATTPQVMLNGTGLVIGSAGVTGNSLLDVYSATAHPVLTISGVHATDYDPQIQFRTDAVPTVKWSLGVDSTDDTFRIYQGTGMGTVGALNIESTAGSIGLGVAPSTSYRLYVLQSGAAQNSSAKIDSNVTTSTNVAYATIAVQGVATATSTANKNTQGPYGLTFSSLVEGAGNMGICQGINVTYGRNQGAGVLDFAYGIQLNPKNVAGTTTYSFGIYANAIPAGGTVTNPYFIYSLMAAPSYLAGSLGIGIASPDSKLHAWIATAGVVTAYTGTIITAESNDNGYINLLTPANKIGGLLFGSPTANNRSGIYYDHFTDIMTVSTAGATLLTLTSTSLGVGTSPSAKIHALSTTEQLRLGYDAGSYMNITVPNGAAATVFDIAEAGASFQFNKQIGILLSTVPHMILRDNDTDTTTKFTTINCKHYTNAEEPLTLIEGRSTSTEGIVRIGGGRAEGNGATQIEFYTAANFNTTSGTKRMQIDTAGHAFFYTVRSGATQAAAGAAASELWKTASHATLPDNVLMIGV